MERMEKQTAVSWLEEELKLNLKKVILEGNSKLIESLFEQAKEMEGHEQMYTYDELRQIAYNAYCKGQLDEPTEGKFNFWIQQFKKK
jgi:hypothetical protein